MTDWNDEYRSALHAMTELDRVEPPRTAGGVSILGDKDDARDN